MLTWDKDVVPNLTSNKDLSATNQTRISHTNCKAGEDTKERLYIKPVSRGYVFHCFNCGDSGVNFMAQKKFLRTEELKDYVSSDGGGGLRSLKLLPADTIIKDPSVIPIDYLAWLYKYGINDDDIKTGFIGWSQSLERLLIRTGANLWTARSLYKEPKYINYKMTNEGSGYFSYGDGEHGLAIITEDAISAYRLKKVFPGWVCNVSGSLVNDIFISKLVSETRANTRVLVWLDPDPAGIEGERKAYRNISPYRTMITSSSLIRSFTTFPIKQPKECSDEELKTAIATMEAYCPTSRS